MAQVVISFVRCEGDPLSDHVDQVLQRVVRANAAAGASVEEVDVDRHPDRMLELDAWICPTLVLTVDGHVRRRIVGITSHRAVLQALLPLLHPPDRALAELRRQLGSPGECFPQGLGRRERRTSQAARVALLAEVDLFRSLSKAQLRDLAGATHEVVFEPGATLTEEGRPGDELFVVVDGTLEVRRRGRRVATLTAGDHVGEMSLLDDLPRSATVKALDQVSVLAIDRPTFRSLLTSAPGIALALLASLSQRLRT